MKLLSYIGLFLGLIIMIVLLIWQGIHEVIEILLGMGPALLWLPLIWSPCLILAAVSWRLLFPKHAIPAFKHILCSLWIGRAINTLLPVATIGGEIAKARLLLLWQYNGHEASASVMVDKTVQALALVPWGFMGAFSLVFLTTDTDLAYATMIGVTLLALGILGFILVQRRGMFGFFAGLIDRFFAPETADQLSSHAKETDALVRELYQQKTRIIMAILWRTAGLVWQTTEVWLACYLLGYPITVVEAIMLKSLSSTLSDIAFFIPNAYGIQEAGYIALGYLIGLPADTALAVSLATRVRELTIDLPGLLVWQHIEGKELLKKHRRKA